MFESDGLVPVLLTLLPALLPVLALGLGFLVLGNLRPGWGWAKVFLRGVVYFGTYAVLGAELLGLVRGLTLPGLAALWLIPIIGQGVWLLRKSRVVPLRRPRWAKVPAPEMVMAIILVLIVAVTGLVALLAPPNTWDSLTYHMARVAHWAQAGSLQHYATGIGRQDLMPPGAEIGMLHAYVLAQGDRLANFPQWLAMVASLVGAAAVARLLGATRGGQLLAAVFVATLPMGIAQASSTMTDYVVAIWVLCVAFESLSLLVDERGGKLEIAPLGLAAGLAILTKPTAFAYLAPFALLVAVTVLRRRGVGPLLAATAVVIVLASALNAGYLGRNLATYGHPLGSQGTLDTHANEIFNGKVLVSNLIRNASLHAGTPWEPVNAFVFRGIIWIHLKMGMSLTDPRTSVHEGFQVTPPALDEKRAGNPLHAATAIVVTAILGVWVLRGRREARLPLLYLGLASATFVVLSSMIKFSVFASRYHLPFFVLLAPAVGYVVGRGRQAWLTAALAVAMALASWSWLAHLSERPLLEDRHGYSVATSPRASLYFMTGHSLEFPYQKLTERIRQEACKSVGVMLSGDSAEYPLWPLLGEPRGDTRLEWIVAGTPSARYTDPTFEPCAVICDWSCPSSWSEIRGLPLTLDEAGYRLYISP